MTQNVYKLTILRLDHRPYRDKRITTHCALVARAFGVDDFLFSGTEDKGIITVITKTNENWGGNYQISYCPGPLEFVKNFKYNGGLVIHLTMYGLSVLDKINELKKIRKNKDVLLIVGGAKVPTEYFEIADYNIAIGNQPHSEVSALALMLYFLDNSCLERNFDDGKLKIIPSNSNKKIIKK